MLYALKAHQIEQQAQALKLQQDISTLKSFDVNSFINNLKDKQLGNSSIFELYRNLQKQNNVHMKPMQTPAVLLQIHRLFKMHVESAYGLFAQFLIRL